MPPAKRKARAYDPERTWRALLAQTESVRGAAIGAAALPGAGALLGQLAGEVRALPEALAEPAPAPAAGRGAGRVELSAWALAGDPVGAAGAGTGAGTDEGAGDPLAALDAAAELLAGCAAEALRPGRLVARGGGVMGAADFALTRLVRIVVLSDDLARTTGVAVPLDRQALAAAVRVTADALAVKAPGGAVEVRIPPFAVVQCAEGPRHTRGTPPNVVETDPLTWLRLASGRVSWAEAREAAQVSASGERADLAELLPLRV
ncbi:sterol carrier family protein [Streptomyces polyrhachis]|uniref:Sterol carrier family protein n=1 Tax=Streptomyces polyrhachis TaxID=1282885 RepID=A0ABW2GKA6_9ACTN